jgi:hypothetical protein
VSVTIPSDEARQTISSVSGLALRVPQKKVRDIPTAFV